VEEPNPSPTRADMTAEGAAEATNPPAVSTTGVADSSTAAPAEAESEADSELPAVPHHGEN
jgi:hypothetical protein